MWIFIDILCQKETSCAPADSHTLYSCVILRGGQAMCFFVKAVPRPSKHALFSLYRSPEAGPLQPSVSVWVRRTQRERAVIVFQFNQLRCDRSLSIHSMMLPLPGSIPTLTPFEMWAVSNGRTDTHHDCQNVANSRLKTVKLRLKLKRLRESMKADEDFFYYYSYYSR